MNIRQCIQQQQNILMEGALGERLNNQSDLVRKRFLGIQANTSPLSYAELVVRLI